MNASRFQCLSDAIFCLLFTFVNTFIILLIMADGEWDAGSGAIKELITRGRDDRWEGEDDDDVKDNWDDEEEEKEDEKVGTGSNEDLSMKAAVKKKRKNLQQIIAEKEEKAKQELLEKMKLKEAVEKPKTPQELLSDKLEKQRLQEESDLKLAKEMIGIPMAEDSLDALSSKDDLDGFKKALVSKLQAFEKTPQFVNFLETLFRELCVSLEPDDIKRISSNLNALFNEKVKQQKATKQKKKTGKGATIKVENNLRYGFEDDYGDDLDDVL